MKKTLILIISTIIFIGNIDAQTQSEIIFIGTSVMIPESHTGIFDGFGKSYTHKKAYHSTNPIIFSFGSTAKNFNIKFFQFNYNDRPNRQPLQTIDYDIQQLKYINVIDIDDFIATKSYEEFYQFMRDNIHSRIWIIDRNDFYKSSPKKKDPDMMKIIQVKMLFEMIPERILNSTTE